MQSATRTILIRLAQREAARHTAEYRRQFEVASPAKRVRTPWMRVTAAVMACVMYFAPAVFLADATAHAALIVDPRAPMQFQPTVTQTSTGVPVLNIPAPNSNGISLSQLSTLDVDGAGLVFNNSLVAGTPLLGGTLGANPNLNGRAASTIIAQVTSTGAAYRSVLAGPV